MTAQEWQKEASAVVETIEEEDRLRRDIKSLTADGRLSAKVLLAMPPAMLAIISVLSPGYATPLANTSFGRMLAMVGVVLGLVGHEADLRADLIERHRLGRGRRDHPQGVRSCGCHLVSLGPVATARSAFGGRPAAAVGSGQATPRATSRRARLAVASNASPGRNER